MNLRNIVLAGIMTLGMGVSCNGCKIKPDIETDLDGNNKPDKVFNYCFSGSYQTRTQLCSLSIKYDDGKEVLLIEGTQRLDSIKAYDKDKDGDIDLVIGFEKEGCPCNGNETYWFRNDGNRKWTTIKVVR